MTDDNNRKKIFWTLMFASVVILSVYFTGKFILEEVAPALAMTIF